MVQFLYEQNIIMYAMAGLCGLGLLVRFIVNMIYKRLVKESDRMGETKNKSLKHMKLKFETCYKLKIGVNNVDTFVDKNLLRYRCCGILLSTWENFCGQVLFLSLLLVPVSTVFGVVYDCEQKLILSTGSVGILASAILIFVDKSINLQAKKRMARFNLLDYLENFCKVRLEQQTFYPELLEQFKMEYFDILNTGTENEKGSKAVKMEDPKDELDRRREARRRKEEEKRALALKREEEQKRLEALRREEERRRIEERKMLAAKRREEERLKMEEERQALEARRLEARRKAEARISVGVADRPVDPVGNAVHSVEEERPKVDLQEMNIILPGLEEMAAEKERPLVPKEEKETVPAPKKAVPKITARMSPDEEKLIEDVLKQFFA